MQVPPQSYNGKCYMEQVKDKAKPFRFYGMSILSSMCMMTSTVRVVKFCAFVILLQAQSCFVAYIFCQVTYASVDVLIFSHFSSVIQFHDLIFFEDLL